MEAKITLNFFKSVYLRNFIPTIVIILINSLSKWYPNIINFENLFYIYGCLLVALYILYSTFKISSHAVYSVNFSKRLSDLKSATDGEVILLSIYNDYNNFIEENKLRLDIYKSFSPIPIVVFSLGILIKWDFNKLNIYSENILDFKLEINSIIRGIIVLLGIWYNI